MLSASITDTPEQFLDELHEDYEGEIAADDPCWEPWE